METTFRALLTGDWEITEERIKIVDPVVDAIISCYESGDYDLFVYTGDLFREFTPKTVAWARETFERVALAKVSQSRAPVILIGNHDRAIGIDKINAILGSDNDGTFDIITKPVVRQWSKRAHPKGDQAPRSFRLAFLPAPDRSLIGALAGPQGPRERDAEISRGLEAALLDLELKTAFQPFGVDGSIIQSPTKADYDAQMQRSGIVFHGTVNTALFGKKPSAGLTWELDASRMKRWGMAIGGHLHEPLDVDPQIHYTGTIAPDTFGIRAESFRIIELELGDGAPEIRSLRLPRSVVQIEIPIGALGIEDGEGTIVSPLEISTGLSEGIHGELVGRGLERDDILRLKLRLKLPKSDLALFDDKAIYDDLYKMLRATPGAFLAELLVKREETSSHKARLENAENAHKLSIDELLKEWAKISALEDHPALNLAVDIVRSSPEFQEWALEGTLGVEPILTEIKNFRQWGEVVVDWRDLKGAVAITGDNATGKTNIAEAPLFAWYKRTPSSGDLRDELRRGEDRGHVIQTWASGGKLYKVVRALERNTKDEVSCKSELFYFQEGEPAGCWLPLVERSTEVDKEIARIIGPYDFVVSTFFGTQDQIDNLVQATPTTWHALIMEALSLRRFEDMRKVASAGSKKAGDLFAQIEAAADLLEKQITTQREEVQEFDREEAKKTIGYRIEETAGREDRVRALRLYEGAINVRLGALGSELARADELTEKIRVLSRKIQPIAVPIPRPADIDQGFDLETRTIELKDLTAKREAALDRFQVARGELVLLEDEIGRLNERFKDNQKQLVEREAELEDLNRKEGSLPSTPCDPVVVSSSVAGPDDYDDPMATYGPINKEACPAWLALSSGRAIETIKKSYETLQQKQSEIQRAWSEAAGRKGDKAGDVGRAEAELQALSLATKTLADLVGTYNNKKAALDLWEAATQNQRLEKQRRDELVAEMTEAHERLTSFADKETEVHTLKDQSRDTSRMIQDEVLAISQNGKLILELEKKISANLALAERLAQDERRLEAKRLERDTQGKIYRAWELLLRAFHGTGIPFLLMERALPQIEAEANRILAPTDLSLRIEAQRSTQDGKVKDEVCVTFADPRGSFSLRSSSGAQRAKIGLAGRFALAKVGTEFWGRVPQVFIQDEGWDRFHETRLGEAAEIIRAIAQVFKRFVFITHVTKLAEAADIRLATRSINGQSSLEVMQ